MKIINLITSINGIVESVVKFKKLIKMQLENKVELLDYMGGDKLHSLAAWASTFFEMGIDLPKDPKIRVNQIVEYILSKSKKMRSIDDLLTYLAVNKHESPFRMSSFVFGMTTDIATHIQKLKHRIILESENAESAKYKELKDNKFYVPKEWYNIAVDFSNFSSQAEECFRGISTWGELLQNCSQLTNELYHHALLQLKDKHVLGNKRAKETSRYFKMYNSQINSINKFSFDGVIQFYNKRTVNFAQEEIKNIAKEMVENIRNIPGNPFEYSLKAFNL